VKQRCRFCGCTDDDACPDGCSWTKHNLCSECAEFLEKLKAYWMVSRKVTKASLGRMLDEVTIPFMGTREKADAWRTAKKLAKKLTGVQKAGAKA
jgi:hypothetical protein